MSEEGSAAQSGAASTATPDLGGSEWKKTMSRLQGNARGVIFAGRLNKADSKTEKPVDRLVGSLKSFVPEDILGNFQDWIEFPEGYEEDGVSTKWPEDSPPASPSQASQRLSTPGTKLPPLSPTSPGVHTARRRKAERPGDRLTLARAACARHEQLRELVPYLPPDPPRLSRSARRKLAERRELEAKMAQEQADRQQAEARQGFAKARFRALGFAVLRKLRLQDEDFFERLRNSAVQPMSKPIKKKVKLQSSKDDEDFDPFYHHLRHVRRKEETSPRRAAKREELTQRGNFTSAFLADLAVKPRVDSQPLLAFMEQGDFMSAVEQKNDTGSEQVLLARRLKALRGSEPRGVPEPAPEEPGGSFSRNAKRKFHPGGHAPAKSTGTSKGSQMQRMLELLDPGRRAGHVNADALVPLMFWLGLTKSRAAALETLRMGFGSLQIDDGALMVMGEHVEVQMRLVEGLRQLVRRDSLELLCEYLTGGSFQRLRTWFNSMRADQFGCVDITQVQSLFARMEVTTDRQTLFRLLSYMTENPHPSAAGDAREAAAIENKKFSLNGFGSLLCRCATSWCLHRMMAMLSTGEDDTIHDVANRWIQLQRKIMISLMVNQRFWGRESRQVLSSLQAPQIHAPDLEELRKLSPEQWNVLFQRVRAQGLASVLLDHPEEPNG